MTFEWADGGRFSLFTLLHETVITAKKREMPVRRRGHLFPVPVSLFFWLRQTSMQYPRLKLLGNAWNSSNVTVIL